MSKTQNFWGDETPNESPAKASAARLPHPTFNIWWLIAAVAASVLLIAAIVINLNHEESSTVRVADALDIDNGDEDIDWSHYPTSDLALTAATTITKAGTYHLTGEIEDGGLTIDVGETVVRLILDNVTITNSSGPAINCQSADDLVIELVGTNTLTDGDAYSSDYDAEVTGTIFSKADLTFTGNGSLDLIANFADGIVSKDDLKFTGGSFSITAADDAIRGTDSVYIKDGDFVLDATANAIKSTNEVNAKKGFVLIEGGNYDLMAENKGIKAINAILIKDGNFVLETHDDAIHSDNFVGITGGTLNLSAGDDAIHANSELLVEDGDINVAKSYEGLEAQVITINAGKIQVATSDDGLNAGGGSNNTNTNTKQDAFNVDETCILTINGGEIYVNASGDGIDSNGWLYFNGGVVVVDGPTNNGNGALDAGAGIVMNGGEVIAVGASGMAENLGSNSSVFNLSVFFSSTQSSDTEITIKNSSDEAILSHTAAKTFNHAAIGSTKFHLGETYTIYLDGEAYQSFTISEITTTIGQTSNTTPGRK